MQYRNIPENKLELSQIGFGCWAIGGHGYGKVDDKESIETIRVAFDKGINLFDTADVYGFGHSEKILSEALGSNRSKVIIATKGGVRWDDQGNTCKDSTSSYIRKAVEQSLIRLKVEQISIYQLHWYDSVTPIEEIFTTLDKLKDEGKIANIGVSNVDLDFIKQSNKYTNIVTNQLKYSLISRENEKQMEIQSTELNIGTLCYGILSRGLLSGNYNENSNFGVNDTRSTDDMFTKYYNQYADMINKLKSIAKEYQCSPTHIAIKWTLSNKYVTSALIGMKNKLQVEDNCKALGLPDEILSLI